MAITKETKVLSVKLENIPTELQQFNNFVMWKAIQLDGPDTLTKVPYNAKIGRKAKVTDPNSWSTFEQVSKSYSRGKYSGIGIVIEESMNLVAIDIDNVTDPTTDERVIPLLDVTYCEISPSGKGIRAFIFGDVGAQYQPSFNNREAGYEAYTCKRYVTLTGQQVSSVSAIATDTDLINSIYSQYGEKFTPSKEYQSLTLDSIKRIETPNSEVFRRIKKANPDKKERILELYEHGPEVMHEYGFESQSDADYSLISDLLFYADNDYVTVDQIMQESALYRDKYDSPRRFLLDGSITASYGFNSIVKLAVEYNDKKTYSEYVSENRVKASDEFTVITEGWLDMLELHHKTGAVLPTRANIEAILERDPNLAGAFKYDDFSQKKMIGEPPIWRKVTKDNNPEFTDTDLVMVRDYIGKTYKIENFKVIGDSVEAQFYKNKFHPLREYLDSLEWDNLERLDRYFIDYLGAEDTAYNRRITQLTIMGAIARIYTPGIKFDTMLLVLGKQGIGKSLAIKKLAGEYFNDSTINFGDKDSYLLNQGVWIHEVAELASMNKRDANEVKMYLTSTHDRFRAPYSREPKTIARQSILIGTSNDTDVLRDDTGARRFLILKVGVNEPTKDIFNIPQSEIDQILAEAKYRYEQGATIYLNTKEDSEIIEVAEALRESHQQDNGIKSSILDYINNPLPDHSRFLHPENLHLTYEQDGKRYVSRLNAKTIFNEAMSGFGIPSRSDSIAINKVLNSLDILEKRESIRVEPDRVTRGYIVKGRIE